MSGYTSPTPLTTEHDVTGFISGQSSLDSWLQNRAQKNDATGASRTYVTTLTGTPTVAGYYSLAASAVELETAPGKVRRNMPAPIPVILLGRLAAHADHQGQGLGGSLLQDAFLRVASAADVIGVRALLVHAIDESATRFYLHHGFTASPLDEQTLFLTLDALRASITEASH
ncbi:GNAT family N-acetyltransferase [Frondihabitans cladoniiphilus]|uniref:GNAT family N-acetyltransferase n=1 Tax=Frondihabitans cladoniiphilus TaxID=715785 RepID=A0ABP8W752_9MICO